MKKKEENRKTQLESNKHTHKCKGQGRWKQQRQNLYIKAVGKHLDHGSDVNQLLTRRIRPMVRRQPKQGRR